MYSITRKIFTIAAIIIAAALIFVIAFFGYLKYQDMKAEDEWRASLNERVRPHNIEINNLRMELSDLYENCKYTPTKSSFMVGFLVSDASDVDYIRQKAKKYSFTPVAVINCDENMDNIKKCIDALDAEWEIMFYADAFSKKINDNVLKVKEYVDGKKLNNSKTFLLRQGYDTETNIELLREDGFVGYTVYHASVPSVGQHENGMYHFDYSLIRSDNASIEHRLSECYEQHASMIFTFSMYEMKNKGLTDTFVEGVLTDLKKYTDAEDCDFATIAQTGEELSQIHIIEAAKREESREREEEIKQRISDLQVIISKIYSEEFPNK